MTTIRDIAHDVQRDNPQFGSKADVEACVKATLACILERTAKGDRVNLRGFGVFTSRLYKGRTLNSPLMEGGEIAFKDQYVLRFKQSAQAKKIINGIVNGDPKVAKAAKKAAKADKADKAAKATSKKGSKPKKPSKSKSKKPAKPETAPDNGGEAADAAE